MTKHTTTARVTVRYINPTQCLYRNAFDKYLLRTTLFSNTLKFESQYHNAHILFPLHVHSVPTCGYCNVKITQLLSVTLLTFKIYDASETHRCLQIPTMFNYSGAHNHLPQVRLFIASSEHTAHAQHHKVTKHKLTSGSEQLLIITT